MKPNKQLYIDFIISELNKGNVQYKDVLLLFVTKFDLTKQTFVRYWKKANEDYRIAQNSIKKDLDVERITLEKKTLKSDVYYKEMILQKMEDIMQQKAKKIEGQLIMPTYSDVIRACERISKMMGIDAPAQIEQKNTFSDAEVFNWTIKNKK